MKIGMPRMMFGGAALVAILSCSWTAAAEVQPSPSSASGALPADGPSLYVRVGCAQCHGGVGQGGSAGPALIATRLSYQDFERLVREPVNQMPPYTAKVLSADQMRAIYDFVLAFGR